MTVAELHQKCIASGKYPLLPGATRLVPGVGNPHADIMCIGEAPGADEDKQGIPFVGRAGQFFNTLLESIGLNRDDIYITNMVKSRPPDNRDPEESELETFKPWLDYEIKLIQPKIFVPLGRFALSRFVPNIKISQAHGKAFRDGDAIYFVMYHPAVALYNGGMRKVLESDFQLLGRILKGDESEVEPLHKPLYEGKSIITPNPKNSPHEEESKKQVGLFD